MQLRRAWGLLPLALLLLAWELAVQAEIYPSILLPPPTKVRRPASGASPWASRSPSCLRCRSA
jgi:ABC-type nitrate/sulfonate/bicarbonate transport system permease component